MQLPLIHLNGTSKNSLVESNYDVVVALQRLLEKMRISRPHPRDYYPLGEEAYSTAITDFNIRYSKIVEILNEWEEYTVRIDDGGYKNDV